MMKKRLPRRINRRDFLKLGAQGAIMATFGGSAISALLKSDPIKAAPAPPELLRVEQAPPARPNKLDVYRRMAATDGFISLPGRRGADPDGKVFVFGFVDVPLSNDQPGLIGDAILGYKGKVQGPAPILEVNEFREGIREDDFHLTITNLGFQQRPDLDDSHTVHWHGFRNPNAVFDGVPEVSIAIPPGRDFTYFFRPRDPGSYMYHCHFEDTEHVQMGMDGIVMVHPIQNLGSGGIPIARLEGNGDPSAPLGYAYNDGAPPGDINSTAYDRHFALLLNEIDTTPHDQLLAVQEFVWSDYDPNYWVINARSYPDTVISDQELEANPELASQPVSALVQANEGERILLRFANLGYQNQAMQLLGIRMRVLGIDAGYLGAANAYETTTIYIGPGEARDAFFTAPDYNDTNLPVFTDSANRSYNRYWLKNRNFQRLVNNTQAGLGGQITEVRVYPSGTLGLQSKASQTF